MATVVTVTGGAGKPAISLSFGDSRTAVAAQSVASIISNEFSGAAASYATAPGTTTSSGYAVINVPGTSDNDADAQAVVATQPATILGGGVDQFFLAQGDISYTTASQNGEIVVADGSNSIGIFAGLNTIYGGTGSDTINVLANFNGTVTGGVTTIYAGSGTTTINGSSGSLDVIGSDSVTGMLTVLDGDAVSTVNGGAGTLSEYAAAGLAIGGAAGGNTIDGSNVAPVTIVGGGVGNTLNGDFAGTMITAGLGNDTITASTGDESIVGGAGSSTVNIYAGTGTVAVFGGAGAEQVNVNTGSVSFTGGAGSASFNVGDSGGGTINGGSGSLYVSVSGGDTSAMSVQGGSSGSNDLFGGAGATTLVGGGNNDYIVAGSGNTSLVGSQGAGVYSLLVAGSGNDTLVGNANANGTTNFSFDAVSGFTNQQYTINNFDGTAVPGATNGDNIYLMNYSSIVQNGANVVIKLNAAGTSQITLTNTTVSAVTPQIHS